MQAFLRTLTGKITTIEIEPAETMDSEHSGAALARLLGTARRCQLSAA